MNEAKSDHWRCIDDVDVRKYNRDVKIAMLGISAESRRGKKKPRSAGLFVLLLIDVIRGLEYWKLACLSGLA